MRHAAIALLVSLGLIFATQASAALPARFGTEGDRAGQLSEQPFGLAVSQQSGDVFIADRNNNRIVRFGGEGGFKLAWGWGVADGSSSALQTCMTTCFAGIEGAGSGQFAFPEGVAIDNDSSSPSFEDVYVVDARNHRVEKFGPNGAFILMFGREVNATPATAHPNVCLAGEQCRAAVEVPEGTVAGNGQFEAPASIAVDGEGTVYVGDTNRVQKFNPAGEYIGQLTLAGAGFTTALAVDASKDVYLKSSELPGVREFDEGGTELGTRDATGEPSTIALGAAGELFVNDEIGSHHILEYSPAGTQTASFDANTESGRRGIAYGDNLNVIYVLNQGAVRLLTPPPPGPLVLAGSERAEAVQPTTATLRAMVNAEGPQATHYHFEYGTTTSYGENTPEEALGGEPFEDQPASAAITGLQPRTLYHFRVVSIDKCEKEPEAHPGVEVECVTEGPDRTFTTTPPVSIDGESVSQVSATGAQLEAELNPHGLESEYRFEYDITPYGEDEGEHGTKLPAGSTGSGTVDLTRSAELVGLEPSRTYYYRVVARNALNEPGEYVLGPDRSFTTQGAAVGPGVGGLPDHRQWELVSPPNKHGSSLEPITEEGGVIQAAAGGGGIAYIAKGPIGAEPPGVRSPEYSQLLAARGLDGWATQDITTPHDSIAIVQAGFPSEYKLFSEDLSGGLVEPKGATPLARDDPANTERTPYLRSDFAGDDPEDPCTADCYEPLVSSIDVPPGTRFGGVFEESTGTFNGGITFVTATPDLSHVVLSSPQVLTPESFKPGFVAAEKPNLYELAGGTLSLVSVLPDREPAAEAGLAVGGGGTQEQDLRNAISADGDRVAFETDSGAGEQHLYLRDVALGETVQIDAPQAGVPVELSHPVFQGASSDGGDVFFTDTAKLTGDSTAVQTPAEPDLYECEASLALSAGERDCSRHLTDLSADRNAGEAANVQGAVSAIDPAGDRVYFAADGVLTNTPNTRGEVPLPGDCNSEGEATCNMYRYDSATHAIGLVAVLSSRDRPDWSPGRHGLANLTARVSPNGRYLAFMSQRPLTGYDNEDVTSKAPGERLDQEVYLYDATTGRVVCASCDPSGARPRGVLDPEEFPGLLVDHPRTWTEHGTSHWLAASIPGWTGVDVRQALYQSRYLSDGGRMFFNAADALVPQDSNGVEDVYEYEPTGGPESEDQPASNSCTTASSTYSPSSGGCVGLISSGTSSEESAFLDASENGDDVFFLTASRLVPQQDVDSALDVYDAHVCSAESPCIAPPAPPPAACEGDACQNAGEPPSFPTPSTLVSHGQGNFTQKPAVKAKAKGGRALNRAQKLSKALKTCRKKKQGSKRKGCEASARKKYGPIKKAKKGASKKKK